MSNVLITGVTGFLGSSLVRHFASNSTIRLFGYSRNTEEARRQFTVFPLEMVEACSVEVLNRHNIHTVIHLAGIAHDLSNQYKDEDYFRVNYEGTVKLYDAFLKSEASRFVFLSSIKAAVDVTHIPVDEEVKPEPMSVYGKSKLQAERYIQDQHTPVGKYFYLLRPCMVHGPGNKGNLNLLYKFLKLGLPYPLGAFHNQRSFLGIDNFNFIVDQFVHGEIPSGIYHLSDDGALSTNQLINIIAQTMGKKPRILKVPKGFVRFLFSLYNKRMLEKLSEDMVVSNNRVVVSMGKQLPVSIAEGLQKTVRSFETPVDVNN